MFAFLFKNYDESKLLLNALQKVMNHGVFMSFLVYEDQVALIGVFFVLTISSVSGGHHVDAVRVLRIVATGRGAPPLLPISTFARVLVCLCDHDRRLWVRHGVS